MPDPVLISDTASRQGALVSAAYWLAFFATSVYGHVALKLAVARAKDAGSAASVLWSGFTSWWGVSAYVAWGVSCLCWMMCIARTDLLKASSVSSLSYVLICASAVAFLGESLTWPRAAGVMLIAAGIMLVK